MLYPKHGQFVESYFEVGNTFKAAVSCNVAVVKRLHVHHRNKDYTLRLVVLVY